jgi:hypothetical protein
MRRDYADQPPPWQLPQMRHPQLPAAKTKKAAHAARLLA